MAVIPLWVDSRRPHELAVIGLVVMGAHDDVTGPIGKARE